MKILIVGDSGVGKTCLFNEMSNQFNTPASADQRAQPMIPFVEPHHPTIGANFKTLNYTSTPDTTTLQVWDMAGRERYKPLLPMYFSQVDIVYMVVDITSQSSFDHLKEWVKTITDECVKKANKSYKVFLLVNKVDQPGLAVMTRDGIENLAVDSRVAREDIYFVSAKSGENVRATVEATVKKSVNKLVAVQTKNEGQSEKESEQKQQKQQKQPGGTSMFAAQKGLISYFKPSQDKLEAKYQQVINNNERLSRYDLLCKLLEAYLGRSLSLHWRTHKERVENILALARYDSLKPLESYYQHNPETLYNAIMALRNIEACKRTEGDLAALLTVMENNRDALIVEKKAVIKLPDDLGVDSDGFSI